MLTFTVTIDKVHVRGAFGPADTVKEEEPSHTTEAVLIREGHLAT